MRSAGDLGGDRALGQEGQQRPGEGVLVIGVEGRALGARAKVTFDQPHRREEVSRSHRVVGEPVATGGGTPVEVGQDT